MQVASGRNRLALVRLARFEDGLLERWFGDEFAAYRARSRLILPLVL